MRKEEKMLYYFILGVLFVEVIFPLLDCMATVIAALLEVFKGKCSVKLTEYNCQIQKLSKGLESDDSETRVIGFAVNNIAEEAEDEDGDEPEED
jgi:hypothetical protein